MPTLFRCLRAARWYSCAGWLLLGVAAPVCADGGFSSVGGLVFSRSSGAVVTTPDGRVLVISDSSVERYDPATRLFSFAGWLVYNHGTGVTATLLADGTVLIAGGHGVSGPYGEVATSKAELFDPTSGSSNPVPAEMTVARAFHTATRLDDGRVLLAGGHSGNFYNSALSSAELYDPATQTFSPTGSMGAARQDAAAVLLAGGQVLVSGGYDETGLALPSADVYDAGGAAFVATGSMLEGRANHTVTVLGTGTVLVIGGHTGFPGPSLATTERFDTVSGTFSGSAAMAEPRGAHTASLLSDGRVLVAGGFTAFPFTGQTLASAEIYDPASDTFVPTHGMGTARGRHMAASLASGDVVVAGGLGFYSSLSSAELFSPTYVDDQAPVVSVPPDMTVGAYDSGGTYVYYQVSATDNSDSNPTLSCQPPSGSVFPVGTTTVVCQATDSWGNSSTSAFNVTVLGPLAVTLTVDGFGSVDPRSGVAVLTGTVRCSRTSTGWVSGQLKQVISTRATLSAFFSTYLTCTPEGTAWTGSSTPTGGRFKPGKADVESYASMSDAYSSAFVSAVRAVQLRGKD